MNERENIKFKVCVRCATYNHANYIIDTLNGFTMQETDFPFVCCVIDDASTDGEQNVIKEYLQKNFDLTDSSVVRNEETNDYYLTYAQHRTNRNCYFAVLYLKYNHFRKPESKSRKFQYISEWNEHTEYIALCEGDDYWVDRNKLQVQVTFLDSHPNINMCTHACQIVGNDKKVISVMRTKGGDHILDTGKLIEGVGAGRTVTLVYRPRLYDNRPSFWSKLRVGDYPLCIYYAINGGIYYIDKVMSTYRRFTSNSWTSRAQKDHIFFLEHVEKMIVWVKEFDEYTNYRYHENVEKRIDYCQFLIYLRQNKWQEIYRSRFFKSLKMKQFCKIVVRDKCPKLFYELRRLSNNFKRKTIS